MAVGRRRPGGYALSRLVLVILVVLTFIPFLILINMSLRPGLLTRLQFFGLPNPIHWQNFVNALQFVGRPILNSLLICVVALLFLLVMVGLAAYAFARFQFKGKTILFVTLLATMMIPPNLLLIPNYRLIDSLGLLNTYWALILPYAASQQIGIVLARTFYESLPQEMFEAAEIDGAGPLRTFLHIALPLSKPILITVGIFQLIAIYNDYIWPTLVLTQGGEAKTFAQTVFINAGGNGTLDMGMLAAAFIVGTIPLLIVTLSCLKYYLQGMVDGAVKM